MEESGVSRGLHGLKGIGLVGCGRWGRHILRDLRLLGCDVTVMAVSDDSVRRAREGGAHRIVHEFEDLEGLSGFVVASPTNTHYAVIDRLLRFKVPIFSEKPLTCNPDDAADLVRRAPERLFVMDKWRYHPGIELLAQIAREKRFGEVRALRTTRLGWGNPHQDVDSIWILIPHDLAITIEVLGGIPEPRAAVVSYAGGEAAGMVAILGGNPSVVLEVGSRRMPARREFILECDLGVAVVDDSYDDHVRVLQSPMGAPRASTHGDPPDQVIPIEIPVSAELPLLRELRVFVDHLLGGPAPRSSAKEGAMIVQTVSHLRKLAGMAD